MHLFNHSVHTATFWDEQTHLDVGMIWNTEVTPKPVRISLCLLLSNVFQCKYVRAEPHWVYLHLRKLLLAKGCCFYFCQWTVCYMPPHCPVLIVSESWHLTEHPYSGKQASSSRLSVRKRLSVGRGWDLDKRCSHEGQRSSHGWVGHTVCSSSSFAAATVRYTEYSKNDTDFIGLLTIGLLWDYKDQFLLSDLSSIQLYITQKRT